MYNINYTKNFVHKKLNRSDKNEYKKSASKYTRDSIGRDTIEQGIFLRIIIINSD